MLQLLGLLIALMVTDQDEDELSCIGFGIIAIFIHILLLSRLEKNSKKLCVLASASVLCPSNYPYRAYHDYWQ